jgi:hypothetical protein
VILKVDRVLDIEFGQGELCTHLIIELYARVCSFFTKQPLPLMAAIILTMSVSGYNAFFAGRIMWKEHT